MLAPAITTTTTTTTIIKNRDESKIISFEIGCVDKFGS